MRSLAIHGLAALCLLASGGPHAAKAFDDAATSNSVERPADELPPPAQTEVDFQRDIQPLLTSRCHACHGSEMAEGGLRLDLKDEALRGGASGLAIEPERSAESRLIRYVSGLNDEGLLMPPEGEPLTAAEIGLLRAWIDQGAPWPEAQPDPAASTAAPDHWSFQPIQQVEPPAVRAVGWVRNPIDQFVLSRLETLGIEPSPEADRYTLIRRLSLDLLGLLPAPHEVDAFVADSRAGAYERLVERLLASPHYGERWGRHWLDLARYADSDGYEKDTGRPHAWRYRTWVIDALNRDLPFDQFTIQQLAGDLAGDQPGGLTAEARVATGFHRNTLTNREGGVDPEEDRVKRTVDRVNTTGSIWLGLTVGCAECHSHKYDPIAQREYYGLYAFFNGIDEVDVPAPLDEQVAAYQEARQAFDAEQAQLKAQVSTYEQEVLPTRQAEWERSLDLSNRTLWTTLEGVQATSAGGATLSVGPDGSVLAQGTSPETDNYTIVAETQLRGVTGLRLEALSDPNLPAHGPGRVEHGNFVLSELSVSAASPDAQAAAQPLTLANPQADFAQDGFPVANCLDGDAKTGWAVAPQFGRSHVAVFEVAGAPMGDGPTRLTITLDQQHGEKHTLGRVRLSVTASPAPLEVEGFPAEIAGILAIEAAGRTAEQQAALRGYYRSIDPELARLEAVVAEHATKAPPDPSATTKAQAVTELSTPRPTHIHLRGDFLRPGAAVEPHTPAVLHPLEPRGARTDRLDLARWLVDPANPLTARVTVNRVWQRYFGRGLVATVDDFGTQGQPPTHPELLDWLSGELIEQGWSLKQLHRLIVTSATYRQSSRLRPELVDRDPENLLLARQRRLRVEAEIVRDLALSASGLLRDSIGGQSVRPPQPAGISELTYSGSAQWVESTGADRYRRGMYTWFQRTSPYPMLMTFDAPDSNVTCTRRERSNTPLQALTLMNDAVFVECSQGLARRIVSEAPADGGSRMRLGHGFRLCLARPPDEAELAELESLLADQLALCRADPASATRLAGESPMPEGIEPAELAAWVVLARTLLNLDEFITRE